MRWGGPHKDLGEALQQEGKGAWRRVRLRKRQSGRAAGRDGLPDHLGNRPRPRHRSCPPRNKGRAGAEADAIERGSPPNDNTGLGHGSGAERNPLRGQGGENKERRDNLKPAVFQKGLRPQDLGMRLGPIRRACGGAASAARERMRRGLRVHIDLQLLFDKSGRAVFKRSGRPPSKDDQLHPRHRGRREKGPEAYIQIRLRLQKRHGHADGPAPRGLPRRALDRPDGGHKEARIDEMSGQDKRRIRARKPDAGQRL